MGELDPVVQKFIADVEEYVRNVQAAAGDAQAFAAANEEAKVAVKGMRDSAAEAALSTDELRNRLAETAAAAGITRDEMGKLHDAQGKIVSDSVLTGLALGHDRDKALEAAAAFKRLRDAVAEADITKSGGGLLSSLFGGGGGSGGGIPMGSGMMSLPVIGAIAVAVETLLPEVVGLASGFAAAGAGAVGFGLLAHPALSSLKQDYQALQSAQEKYQHAQAIEAADPTKAHLKAVHDALVNLQVVRQGMTQDEASAAGGVAQLSQEYHKLTTAFRPEAFKVFSGVLTLANQLLPTVTPFARTFADALSGLLGKASGFAGSQGFKDWLEQFHKLEGPSITAIGDGIGKVAVAVGKLLTAMSAKDVVNAINIAFTILAGTVNVVTYMLKRLMDNWDGMSAAAKHSWYDIKRWTDDVTQAFDTVRHSTAQFGHDWAGYFDTARHDVATWGHDAASAFDTVRHGAATLGHDTASTFDTIRHTIATWAGDVKTDTDRVVSWFKGLPGEITRGLGDLSHLLINAGRSVIDGLITGLVNAVPGLHQTLSWVSSLIPSWKGPLDADRVMLVPHGHAMIAGLIDGIRAHMPALREALGQVSGTVTGTVSAGLGAAALGPGGGGGPVTHVTVPITLQGGTAAAASPQYLQGLQAAVQEAVLRYDQVNATNGFTPAWGR